MIFYWPFSASVKYAVSACAAPPITGMHQTRPDQTLWPSLGLVKNLVIPLTWYWLSGVMDFFSQFQSNPTWSRVTFVLTLCHNFCCRCSGDAQNRVSSDYGFFICILDSEVGLIMWVIRFDPNGPTLGRFVLLEFYCRIIWASTICCRLSSFCFMQC